MGADATHVVEDDNATSGRRMSTSQPVCPSLPGIDEWEPVGMTVQAFCSLSVNPPLISICPGLTSTTWSRLQKIGRFTVNLLAEGQEPLAGQFAKSGTDRYVGVSWRPSNVTGSPVLDGCLAWIDCGLQAIYPGGDHLIAVCAVRQLSARIDRRALVFFRGGFQKVAE
jgi:flavin reductase (DIM6/NTAB) family NADH-FMN oxidoreductase RutF